jgi:hypothetical protein
MYPFCLFNFLSSSVILVQDALKELVTSSRVEEFKPAMHGEKKLLVKHFLLGRTQLSIPQLSM